MNFVASVIVILAALNVFCGKTYVVSYATIKNPASLAKFFLMKRITITFLTPSYVRKLGDKTGPFLRMLFVGSEPANNIYNKNLDLINIYAASESGSIDTIPEIEGLAVWKSGHIGVYIGGGYVIEAMGTMYGVVRTELTGRGWEGWCKIPFISYDQ